MSEPRDLCLRCLRPRRVCYCAHLATLETRTHVVFLQHPREHRMPIGTARMAHLALPNSELHVGLTFDALFDAWTRERSGVALLFPSDDARPLEAFAPGELKTLVVVDGTWSLARKLIRLNPGLQALPKLSFVPQRPGNYRIRREPAAHCLSTIEAVVEVLGHLEGDPARFRQMLRAFEVMVDRQLEHARLREGPSRHEQRRRPLASRAVRLGRGLCARYERLVLCHAESNAQPSEDGQPRAHELIHLVALRPATLERLELWVRPGSPLQPSTCLHAEVSEAQVLDGVEKAQARERVREFLRPGDVVCGWGAFLRGLIYGLGLDAPWIDLRDRALTHLGQKPGGLEQAAALLGGLKPPQGHGRAGRRVGALWAVLEALCEAERQREEASRAAALRGGARPGRSAPTIRSRRSPTPLAE